MRALAILVACCAAVAATPSQAFGHFGAPHPGGFPHGFPNGHGHHGRGEYGGSGGGFDATLLPAASDEDAATPAPAPPFAILPPPRCPAFVAAPVPHPGPHIIYVGYKPVIRGPKVIYGTD